MKELLNAIYRQKAEKCRCGRVKQDNREKYCLFCEEHRQDWEDAFREDHPVRSWKSIYDAE